MEVCNQQLFFFRNKRVVRAVTNHTSACMLICVTDGGGGHTQLISNIKQPQESYEASLLLSLPCPPSHLAHHFFSTSLDLWANV